VAFIMASMCCKGIICTVSDVVSINRCRVDDLRNTASLTGRSAAALTFKPTHLKLPITPVLSAAVITQVICDLALTALACICIKDVVPCLCVGNHCSMLDKFPYDYELFFCSVVAA